ncbi:MAG: PQQ-binding-like beta-propeller repeat protein [Acidobacteriota bacterium]
MISRHRWIAVAAVASTLATAARADWPLFRGDARLTGMASGVLPEHPEPLWTFQADEGIESTAALAGGLVYVGSLGGSLYALESKTGKVKWTYRTGDEIKSSPSVHGGTVYFGDEGGAFHALDARSGEERWTIQVDAGVISSANFAGRCVLFGSQDNSLYCVAPRTGRRLWSLETGSYIYSTPSVVDLDGEVVALITGCDGLLRVVRVADGTQIRAVDMGAYVGASPAVSGGRAFVGTFDNQVLGIDLEAGRVAWTFEDPDRPFPFYSSAAVGEKAVVVGGRDKRLHALDRASGRSLWTFSAGGRIDGSPVILGRRVFFGALDGRLYALDLSSGEKLWQFDTGSALVASPSIAAGHLVIGTRDGVLYCFGKRQEQHG